MTQHDDHGTLPAHAAMLVERLDRIRGRFIYGRVGNEIHNVHEERCRVLANHLAAILNLCEHGQYAAGLAVTRTALEHHLLDRLLFLANRWVQIEQGIKKGGIAAEEARLAGLKATTRRDIVRWEWDPKLAVMKVIIKGLFSEGSRGTGQTISPYYFYVDRYDPFALPEPLSSKLAVGFRDPGVSAKRHEESYRSRTRYFTYGRLRDNLDANGLLRPRLGIQVDVHHAFLNAFVHASKGAYERIHGRNSPSHVGRYDHYASELLLLYVIAIAAAELEVFARMTRRRPRIGLRDWAAVEHEIDEARLASSHFWFLSGGPTTYDRIVEADTRMGIGPWPGRKRRPRPDPSGIPERGVRYYPDPLDRLIKMHGSYQELVTGEVYVSPFARPDALFR